MKVGIAWEELNPEKLEELNSEKLYIERYIWISYQSAQVTNPH
jgi:hypothetical protein